LPYIELFVLINILRLSIMSPFSTPQLLNRLRMRQVALLLAIGEHGTLRAAAAALGMTQPAATKMLHELEHALGQPLFDRVGRGLRLTDPGRCTLAYFQGLRGTMEALAGRSRRTMLPKASSWWPIA
jgi:molybdate transport repressor ModE-like protein